MFEIEIKRSRSFRPKTSVTQKLSNIKINEKKVSARVYKILSIVLYDPPPDHWSGGHTKTWISKSKMN